MQCPVCNVALTMSDRNGIEIDYCPQCRGVWLDRGELDKIIERAGVPQSGAAQFGGQQAPQAQFQQPVQQQQPQQYQQQRPHRDYDDDDDDDDRYKHRSHDSYHGDSHHGGHHKKKKEGFLGDLFDF